MQIGLAFNTAQNLARKHIFPENTQWKQYVKCCHKVTFVFIIHICVCACIYMFMHRENACVYMTTRDTHIEKFVRPHTLRNHVGLFHTKPSVDLQMWIFFSPGLHRDINVGFQCIKKEKKRKKLKTFKGVV